LLDNFTIHETGRPNAFIALEALRSSSRPVATGELLPAKSTDAGAAWKHPPACSATAGSPDQLQHVASSICIRLAAALMKLRYTRLRQTCATWWAVQTWHNMADASRHKALFLRSSRAPVSPVRPAAC
jgi:hypothetical protein